MGDRPSYAEQRDLLCRFFLDTHVAYDVADIQWPDLQPGTQQFLAGLPIWDEAVNTEHETAVLVRAMADHEPDPVLAEAIAMQAFEEERHATLVTALTGRYGIEVRRRPTPVVGDPVWAFLKSGWGETLDSFVAFGVFALARDLALVPQELLAVFDLVMQEEARHILFFESWRVLCRTARGGWPATRFAAAEGRTASLVVLARLRLAASSPGRTSADNQNFLVSGIGALGDVTPRAFVDRCLAENDRRFAPYDSRLARPRIVPALARALRKALPDRPVGSVAVDPQATTSFM